VNIVVEDIEAANGSTAPLGFEQAVNEDAPWSYPGVDLASPVTPDLTTVVSACTFAF
jgi:hypothetical protein